jgi:SAM-dependent methyltransferase
LSELHPSAQWTMYARPGSGPPADAEAFQRFMRHPRFPRASAYDPMWVRNNELGPNALWLMEDLAEHMDLAPGKQVLDLACGSAMTSIFLAREYGVHVWAADLWIEPTENLARIEEAGVGDRVFPIEAEAHRLPFARGFFDLVLSVDGYHYFGTNVRYLSYLSQFVRPGGQIGIVVPGNSVDPDERPQDLNGPWPERYGADWFTFRSAGWWARHWRRTKGIVVEHSDMIEDGWELWHQHHQAGAARCGEELAGVGDEALLNSPEGHTLGFVRVIGRTTGEQPLLFGPGRYQFRIG